MTPQEYRAIRDRLARGESLMPYDMRALIRALEESEQEVQRLRAQLRTRDLLQNLEAGQ